MPKRPSSGQARPNIVFAIGMLLVVTAQEASTSDSSLKRIREAVARPPAIDLAQRPTETPPKFRVTIEGLRPPDLSDPRPVDRRPSSYVPVPGPTSHRDFLTAVSPTRTPQGGQGFGIGIDVIPMIVAASKAVSAQVRKYRQYRARREVQEEIEQFLAARAALKR
jgi:hypothetical protein